MSRRKFVIRTNPVQIHAPIESVWSVLTDVQKYGEWNPFTPQAETDFSIGSPVYLLVRMGAFRFKITETVCAHEEPQHIGWKKKFGARWLLLAMRGQHLERADSSRCYYYNTDELTGLLAPVIYVCFGHYMRRGFRVVAKGLKAYAEVAHERAC